MMVRGIQQMMTGKRQREPEAARIRPGRGNTLPSVSARFINQA
jgi:hypothetical protein